MIVLLSTESLSSRWVQHEVAAAVNALPRGFVFPIAVGEVDVRTLPPWLADRQWLHLSDSRHVDALMDLLLPALEAALGGRDSGAGKAEVIGELPPRVPMVGVESYLRELRAQSAGTTWIVGMGGVGKTKLAREYAFQVHDQVNFICWLSDVGGHAQQLTQRLRDTAERTGGAGGRHSLIVVDQLGAVLDDVRDQVRLLARRSCFASSHRR